MTNNPIEKTVETITYKGVEFEVVERPDVIWVGSVDYAENNSDEPNIEATHKRHYTELGGVEKKDLINPDFTGVLSINYTRDDKPNGLMFAQETSSDKQDERYEQLTETGGLWLRVKLSAESDNALLGRGNHGPWEYYGPLESAAKSKGYIQNPDIDMSFEYSHNSGNGPIYVYIPIRAG